MENVKREIEDKLSSFLEEPIKYKENGQYIDTYTGNQVRGCNYESSL